MTPADCWSRQTVSPALLQVDYWLVAEEAVGILLASTTGHRCRHYPPQHCGDEGCGSGSPRYGRSPNNGHYPQSARLRISAKQVGAQVAPTCSSGSRDWIRTNNRPINSRMLCR